MFHIIRKLNSKIENKRKRLHRDTALDFPAPKVRKCTHIVSSSEQATEKFNSNLVGPADCPKESIHKFAPKDLIAARFHLDQR